MTDFKYFKSSVTIFIDTQSFVILKLIALFLFANIYCFSQQKIELINANKLKFDKTINENFKILSGEVKFKHDNVIFECDSAFLYDDENKIDAFGNVNISNIDKTNENFNIVGDIFKYSGNTKIGFIEGNVVFKDEQMTLKTDKVDYNGLNNIIHYNDWGYITDKSMQLTSKSGLYHIDTKDFFFTEKVDVKNENTQLNSDTLLYNYNSKIINIISKTKIISDSTTIYTSNGWYNSNTESAMLNYQNLIINDNKTIIADTILYNASKNEIICHSNAFLNDTASKIALAADYMYFNQKIRNGIATKKSNLISYSDADTTFIKGDTIKFSNDTISDEWTVNIEGNSKSFNTKMQSISDTIIFISNQNCVYMLGEPFIWLDSATQISCKYLQMQLNEDKNLKEIYFIGKPFIITKDTSNEYNQIKGIEMYASFLENELKYIDVYNNAESIYFVKDSIYTIGINKIEGDTITISFSNEELNSIFVKHKTTANLISPLNAKKHDLILKGFAYFPEKRPKSKFF